jgi:hypothetical protein
LYSLSAGGSKFAGGNPKNSDKLFVGVMTTHELAVQQVLHPGAKSFFGETTNRQAVQVVVCTHATNAIVVFGGAQDETINKLIQQIRCRCPASMDLL